MPLLQGVGGRVGLWEGRFGKGVCLGRAFVISVFPFLCLLRERSIVAIAATIGWFNPAAFLQPATYPP